MPMVQEVIADLGARETIADGQTFVFHGRPKNACCYLLELGLTDSQVRSMLGMSAAMVRHYGKRSRALMIAKNLSERLSTTSILDLGRKPDRCGQTSNA
jgi:hypothetical protein